MRLAITTTMVAVALAGCLSTTKPSVVNDNPTTGGACHNGDQMGTHCPDGSCAPAGYRCAYDGHGVEIDEGQWGPADVGTIYGAKRKDGGK